MRWADWMVKKAPVYACGKKGKITRVETIRENGERMVKFIYVKLDGGKFSNPYYPSDVKKARR